MLHPVGASGVARHDSSYRPAAADIIRHSNMYLIPWRLIASATVPLSSRFATAFTHPVSFNSVDISPRWGESAPAGEALKTCYAFPYRGKVASLRAG